MVDLKEIEKMFPGKKATIKGGRIVLKDKTSSQRRGTGKTRFSYISHELIPHRENLALQEGKIYIPYEVMSSKNSRVIEYLYRKGEKSKMPILKHSQQYEEYTIRTAAYWKKNLSRFREMIADKETPYRIGFYFIRVTKEIFDYTNLMQGPLDLMVEHKWLPDDNIKIVMPIPLGYEVYRESQGLIISVE